MSKIVARERFATAGADPAAELQPVDVGVARTYREEKIPECCFSHGDASCGAVRALLNVPLLKPVCYSVGAFVCVCQHVR